MSYKGELDQLYQLEDEPFEGREEPMPNMNEVYQSESEYISAADFPRGQSPTLEISQWKAVDFAKEGEASDPKCVIFFTGRDKGIILNRTNYNRLISGLSDDCDEWVGRNTVRS